MDDRHFDLQTKIYTEKALVPIDSRCSISRCHSFWVEQLCHFDAKLCSALRALLFRCSVLLQRSFDESEAFRACSVNFFGQFLCGSFSRELERMSCCCCTSCACCWWVLTGRHFHKKKNCSERSSVQPKDVEQFYFTPNATWSRNLAVGSK
jgi:hypothetical protein